MKPHLELRVRTHHVTIAFYGQQCAQASAVACASESFILELELESTILFSRNRNHSSSPTTKWFRFRENSGAPMTDGDDAGDDDDDGDDDDTSMLI